MKISMKFMRFFQQNKYFTRIFIWITCITVLIISTFSAIIYFKVENNVLTREYENSQKVLLQMKYNIDYLDIMIRNLTLSTYSNNDVKALMYLDEDETYENLKIINNLNKTLVAVNPFIHSIYIYNNHKQGYYSTSDGMLLKDPELEQMLQSYDHVPALKAIVRNMEVNNVNSDNKYETVLSYIMYENVDSENRMDGAVILNIKLDWLLDNIREINQMSGNIHSQLYIMDTNNEFIGLDINQSVSDISLAPSIKEAYERNVVNQQSVGREIPGYFTKSIDKENFLVSYVHLDNTDWTLLEAKPYKEVYSSVQQLMDTILLLTIIILFVALLLSITVSRGIYSPVKKLVEATTKSLMDEDEKRFSLTQTRDEFSYLTEVYQKSKELIYHYQTEKKNTIGIMKLYFLKKLIANSYSMDVQEFESLLREINVNLSIEKPLLIGVLRIDDYKQFLNNKSMSNRELLRFSMINIVTECLSKSFLVQMIDMKDDSFTMIMNAEGDEGEERELGQYLQEAQKCMWRFYGLSFSIAISKKITDYTAITSEYNNSMANSDYKYLYGKGSIITQTLIAEHVGERVEIENVFKLESILFDAVRRGDINKALERLDDLFVQISKLTYSDVRYVNMHIIHHFKKVIYESNQTRKEPLNIQDTLKYRELDEIETLNGFKEHLIGILKSIGDEKREAALKGELVVADTIREIIGTNYADTSLGAAFISDMLKLSPYKLSKISKEHFEMTIPEYINQVRLNKAVEWMGNSKLSIQEIMLKVGIENESYFYKLFKTKFGMTPREYMAKEEQS